MLKNGSLMVLIFVFWLAMAHSLTFDHAFEHNRQFVDASLVDTYNDMKKNHTYRYIIFELSDDRTRLNMVKTGQKDSSWKQFYSQLTYNKCYYVTYLAEKQTSDGIKSKLLFLMFMPDTARVRDKMVYTTKKDDVKKAFIGIQQQIDIADRIRSQEDFLGMVNFYE